MVATIAVVGSACTASGDEPAGAAATTVRPVGTAAATTLPVPTQTSVTAPPTTTAAPTVPPTTIPATTVPPTTTNPPETTTTEGPDGTTIAIGDLFFRPSSLTVTVGEMVVWRHEGNFPHTTTAGVPGAPTNLWQSGTLSGGDTFSVTFDTAGTFQYFCSIHPNDMRGTITVTGG